MAGKEHLKYRIAVEGATGMEQVGEKLQQLSPQAESQRSTQSQALQMSTDLLHSRWLLIEQEHNSLPIPFLVILMIAVLLFCRVRRDLSHS